MVDKDPNRDVHGHSSLSPAPEGTRRNLWPLILGALALLGLLFFLLRGCDEEREEVVVPVEETTAATTVATPVAPGTVAAGTVAATAAPFTVDEFNRTLTGTTQLPVNYALDKVTFDTGSANLSAGAQAQVAEVATALKARNTARVSLRGFADPSGDAAANQKLSEQRVATVRNALIAGGVSADQITAAAGGETGGSTSRDNRRVEISLLQR